MVDKFMQKPFLEFSSYDSKVVNKVKNINDYDSDDDDNNRSFSRDSV